MTAVSRHGLCTPLYSLRGCGDSGIGDMGDLRRLVDLAAALGLGKVELLSVADTAVAAGKTAASAGDADATGGDAWQRRPLHSAFIDLRPLGELINKPRATAYASTAAGLEEQQEVDYARVHNVKMHMLHEHFLQNGSDVLGSEAYHSFWRENRAWLERYSVYAALKHNYGHGHSRYLAGTDYETLLADSHFIKEYSSDIRFHLYTQFLLHSQLRAAIGYAKEKGISLSVCSETPRNVFFGQWWTSLLPAERQEYYSRQLGFSGEAPAAAEPWIAEAYLQKKLSESTSGVVLPLEDWLSMTSVLPARPEPSYGGDRPETWRYRMGITLEKVLSHKSLLGCIRRTIEDSCK